jgi:hypothetical protein
MSTPPPPWPQLIKGALISYDPDASKPTPTVISFQYNPDELSRSFSHPVTKEESAGGLAPGKQSKEKAPTVSGPPIEKIDLRVEIDATDQLAMRNPTARQNGIHPTLAALEMLMMPTLQQEQNTKKLSKQGSAAVGPYKLPLVLFVWGTSRVQPVKVVSLSINETAFDQRLNPIHAEVHLSLQVLTDADLADSSVGKTVALAAQTRRETMAGLATTHAVPEYAKKVVPE